jgi:NADH-quinone oxidoreductase subunit J
MNGLIQQLNNIGLPQEFILKAVFYTIAGLTIFFAVRMVISRNIFHSAVFLALTLIGVACIYLYLDAEFLAIIQILIYVGAIVTLFIFAIMLTARIQDRAIKQVNQQVLISAAASLAFLCLFVTIIMRNPWHAARAKPETLSLEQLGRALMTAYVLPFEVISLVLLVALVGAIVIGKVRK